MSQPQQPFPVVATPVASESAVLPLPQISIIELTPAVAQQLLAANDHNRRVRISRLSSMTSAIRRGEWELNGDTIRVSVTGQLLDGQHRCIAVIDSGVSVQTILVTGLPDRVFSTIDRGAARTTGDVFGIRGDKNANTLAAICRIVHIYNRTWTPYNGNPENIPTVAQQMQLLDDNPEIREAADWIARKKWCRKFLSPSLGGFVYYLFMKKARDAAVTFFEGLETGVGLQDGSPILLLRTQLMESHPKREGMKAEYKAALVFRAFGHHQDGTLLRRLRVRVDGDKIDKTVFFI